MRNERELTEILQAFGHAIVKRSELNANKIYEHLDSKSAKYNSIDSQNIPQIADLNDKYYIMLKQKKLLNQDILYAKFYALCHQFSEKSVELIEREWFDLMYKHKIIPDDRYLASQNNSIQTHHSQPKKKAQQTK